MLALIHFHLQVTEKGGVLLCGFLGSCSSWEPVGCETHSRTPCHMPVPQPFSLQPLPFPSSHPPLPPGSSLIGISYKQIERACPKLSPDTEEMALVRQVQVDAF